MNKIDESTRGENTSEIVRFNVSAEVLRRYCESYKPKPSKIYL